MLQLTDKFSKRGADGAAPITLLMPGPGRCRRGSPAACDGFFHERPPPTCRGVEVQHSRAAAGSAKLGRRAASGSATPIGALQEECPLARERITPGLLLTQHALGVDPGRAGGPAAPRWRADREQDHRHEDEGRRVPRPDAVEGHSQCSGVTSAAPTAPSATPAAARRRPCNATRRNTLFRVRHRGLSGCPPRGCAVRRAGRRCRRRRSPPGPGPVRRTGRTAWRPPAATGAKPRWRPPASARRARARGRPPQQRGATIASGVRASRSVSSPDCARGR